MLLSSNNMSISTFCRLCAQQSDNNVGIFGEEGKNLDLAKKITQCLQILLLPDDALPKEVCKNCCIRLDENFKFFEFCAQAQVMLISLFDEKNASPKGELKIQSVSPEPLQAHSNSDLKTDQENTSITELNPLKTVAKSLENDQCPLEDDGEKSQPSGEGDIKSPTIPASIVDISDKISTSSVLLSDSKLKGRLADSDKKNAKVCKNKTRSNQSVQVQACVINSFDDSDDDFYNDTPDLEGEDSSDFDKFGNRKGKNASDNGVRMRKGWSCAECPCVVRTLPALREHSLTAHKRLPIFKCAVKECGKAYSRYRSYARHLHTHSPEKKHSCEVCGKRFAQKTILKSHKAVHSEERPFSCTQCGKTFKQFSSLFIHGKSHVDPQEKFPCSDCSKLFSSKAALIQHNKSHSGERDFVCDVCGKSFIAKSSFDYHILTHEDIRPHACKDCGKTFRTLKLLTKHSTLHSGVKPFQCDVCGKQFRERSALKEHNRIHTGAMPYSCEVCGKLFRFKGILTVHLRQHTGERPYACTECHRTFTNWANYNKHMKRRHKPATPQPTSEAISGSNEATSGESVSATCANASNSGVNTTTSVKNNPTSVPQDATSTGSSESHHLRATASTQSPVIEHVFTHPTAFSEPCKQEPNGLVPGDDAFRTQHTHFIPAQVVGFYVPAELHLFNR